MTSDNNVDESGLVRGCVWNATEMKPGKAFICLEERASSVKSKLNQSVSRISSKNKPTYMVQSQNHSIYFYIDKVNVVRDLSMSEETVN